MLDTLIAFCFGTPVRGAFGFGGSGVDALFRFWGAGAPSLCFGRRALLTMDGAPSSKCVFASIGHTL